MILLKKIYKLNLLKSKTIVFFIAAIFQHGINLMTLLSWVAKLYPERIAIKTNNEVLTYASLYQKSCTLTQNIKKLSDLSPKMKVGIACFNDISFICSIFACSRLGASIYVLNLQMGNQGLERIFSEKYDLIVYDDSSLELIYSYIEKNAGVLFINYNTLSLLSTSNIKFKPVFYNRITVLSSGTTGGYKAAERKVGAFIYLNPFLSLIQHANMRVGTKIYISVPFYHGFGLATLFFSISLASEIYIDKKTDSKKIFELVNQEKIEILVCVPIILQRMLDCITDNKIDLHCLTHIVSGSAPLSSILLARTQALLGHKLYNLYGTSEAGFATLASPHDLKKHPETIGKPIFNVNIKTINIKEKSIGEICIKSSLVMLQNSNEYIKTGDLGYINDEGYVFLAGRTDDMIVSGGENVYPFQLETTLASHPALSDVAVIGVSDIEFGQRLVAWVELHPGTQLSEQVLRAWLKPQIARFEMPKQIIFIEKIPYNSTGKKDKTTLLRNHTLNY